MSNNYDKFKDWFENDQLRDQVKSFEGFITIDKIKHYSSELTSPKFNTSANYSKIKLHSKAKPSKNNWLKIAAVLIIALSVGVTSFYLSSKKIITEVASTSTLTLPDHSEVILAPNTTINYNDLKWKFKRSVNLTGEAYFKVKKGSSFVVQTKLGQVEVLGTKFNVKQYSDEFIVTCYEGQVKITHNTEVETITAQEQVILKDQKIIKVNQKLTKQPFWVNHKVKFDSALFTEIAERFNQIYGVHISLRISSNKKFTGVLPTTDLDKALVIISQVYQLNVKKNGNKSYIFVTNDAEN